MSHLELRTCLSLFRSTPSSASTSRKWKRCSFTLRSLRATKTGPHTLLYLSWSERHEKWVFREVRTLLAGSAEACTTQPQESIGLLPQLEAYFEKFAEKPSCYEDLKSFVASMEQSDLEGWTNYLRSRPTDVVCLTLSFPTISPDARVEDFLALLGEHAEHSKALAISIIFNSAFS